jgi:hypothetical protein
MTAILMQSGVLWYLWFVVQRQRIEQEKAAMEASQARDHAERERAREQQIRATQKARELEDRMGADLSRLALESKKKEKKLQQENEVLKKKLEEAEEALKKTPRPMADGAPIAGTSDAPAPAASGASTRIQVKPLWGSDSDSDDKPEPELHPAAAGTPRGGAGSSDLGARTVSCAALEDVLKSAGIDSGSAARYSTTLSEQGFGTLFAFNTLSARRLLAEPFNVKLGHMELLQKRGDGAAQLLQLLKDGKVEQYHDTVVDFVSQDK